ncbi:MAG: flagellar M-ring protein FliF, partial [Rhodospirillales bacterium]|nr:flagellar M-ring protein FliF [Rhodospirillales bacterium]
MGYEIFDRGEALGTTSFVQNINHLRALEGELARTIRAIQGVTTARVHLVLPRRELFNRERREPSASIILKLASGKIDQSQVVAVQHLVAAAVPELTPSRVSIVDSRGVLLARGGDEGSAQTPFASMSDKTAAFESRMSQQLEDMLSRTAGYGNVRAEVTAELDYDKITTNSESYDPDGQVVRSSQSVEEQGQEQDGGNAAVSVAENLPQAEGGDAETATSSNSRTEETINYEISRVTKTQVREIGKVVRLSVAVLLNGTYQNQDGERVYVPRRQDEMDKLTALVKSAVGFKDERGDRNENRARDDGVDHECSLPLEPVDKQTRERDDNETSQTYAHHHRAGGLSPLLLEPVGDRIARGHRAGARPSDGEHEADEVKLPQRLHLAEHHEGGAHDE